MIRKWTNQVFKEFVDSYSHCELLTEVSGYKRKVTLKCQCGNEFQTTVEKFVTRNQRQCRECGLKRVYEGNRYKYSEVKSFIAYNSACELLSESYTDTKSKIKIKCGCGETFLTTFDEFKHDNKRQCSTCGGLIKADSIRYSREEIINKVKAKGCELLTEYKDVKSKAKIKCPCGKVFETTLDNFIHKGKNRCDRCTKKMSRGERVVEEWLSENNIRYERQYRIPECRSIKPLPFDFAVLEGDKLKCLIEFDGEQHFNPYRYKDNEVFEYEKLKNLKNRDEIKNRYCKSNSIRLLRISYKENIIEKLKSTLL